MMKIPTGSLQSKAGKWYVVVNSYVGDPETRTLKRKVRWVGTGLECTRGNKSKARHIMETQILPEFAYDTDYGKNLERIRSSRLFLEYLASFLQEKRLSLAIATYDTYVSLLYGRITDYFEKKNLRLSDVKPEDITEFYAYLASEGLKGSSIIHYHSLLAPAMKLAKQRKLIDENPFDYITRPRQAEYVPEYYTAEQARQLLESAKGDPLYVPIVLSTYYGLRRSEVVGLRWKCVDFENKRIVINHKIYQTSSSTKTGIRLTDNCYIVGEDTLKTKSSYRTLPLIPAVETFLLSVKADQEKYKKFFGNCYDHRWAEYICVHKDGRIITPNYISARFSALLDSNGLKHIRFHDLRHSCASMMVQQNVQMKNIQMWLGHSDISTTANIYAHLEFASKVESGNMMNNLLGETPPAESEI